MLLTDTVVLMYKIKAENYVKTSTKIKNFLSSVITQNIQNITIMQIT